MKIYNYSKQTGEFIKATAARLDPLELKKGNEVYLIPAAATKIEPPKTGNNEVAVFDGQKWNIKKDFRKTVYYIDTRQFLITEISIEPPAGTTTEPPPDDGKEYTYDGYNWVEVPVPIPPVDIEPVETVQLTKETAAALAKSKDFNEFINTFKSMVK